MNDLGLGEYYARRACEYEDIYAKPERQADLASLTEHLTSLFEGHLTLEIACGTGYWTSLLAPVCRSILATDLSPEVLRIARSKSYGTDQVRLAMADAYRLDDIEGQFTAGLAAFWWSHVPKQSLQTFLHGFHAKLQLGALVCFVDNHYVEGNSTPISHTDSSGNTYQKRVLNDGPEFQVLKNFPLPTELEAAVSHWTTTARLKTLEYYWCLSYTLGTLS